MHEDELKHEKKGIDVEGLIYSAKIGLSTNDDRKKFLRVTEEY